MYWYFIASPPYNTTTPSTLKETNNGSLPVQQSSSQQRLVTIQYTATTQLYDQTIIILHTPALSSIVGVAIHSSTISVQTMTYIAKDKRSSISMTAPSSTQQEGAVNPTSCTSTPSWNFSSPDVLTNNVVRYIRTLRESPPRLRYFSSRQSFFHVSSSIL